MVLLGRHQALPTTTANDSELDFAGVDALHHEVVNELRFLATEGAVRVGAETVAMTVFHLPRSTSQIKKRQLFGAFIFHSSATCVTNAWPRCRAAYAEREL
jgi:hypothetical protein